MVGFPLKMEVSLGKSSMNGRLASHGTDCRRVPRLGCGAKFPIFFGDFAVDLGVISELDPRNPWFSNQVGGQPLQDFILALLGVLPGTLLVKLSNFRGVSASHFAFFVHHEVSLGHHFLLATRIPVAVCQCIGWHRGHLRLATVSSTQAAMHWRVHQDANGLRLRAREELCVIVI